ncbi:MAG: hypothetical protein WC297_00465 [Candidatus Paceibacterota bacterium]|jgi:hypothetical protein
MTETAIEKIAKILRADKHIIEALEKKLSQTTGKTGVFEKILNENEQAIDKACLILGLKRESKAKEVYDSLISKIEADDNLLFEGLKRPSMETFEGCNHILEIAKKLVGSKKGFFLKIEKAKEILEQNPPKNILKFFGCLTVKELLEKENILEVFCALRFIEDADWLKDIFLNKYQELKPTDFEEREIQTLTISSKVAVAAAEFIQKKYHNISHLKELGIIFILPVSLNVSGELIRDFSLILHYFYEIAFYSGLFKELSKNEKEFSSGLVSLLRGEGTEKMSEVGGDNRWLIIQRYLAKDDENDWRLFTPHINPEALHWEKAEKSLVKAGAMLDSFSGELSFWDNLSWVGDYFKSETGVDILVSFNIVDTAMSLVKEKELIKYLYHHQEALWNKIFIEYFGEEKLEESLKENIIKGYFNL